MKKFIIGNLKMNPVSLVEFERYLDMLEKELKSKDFAKTEVVVCPPIVYLQKLLDRKAALVKEGQELLAKADAESRELSVDEKSAFDKTESDLVALNADVAREEKLATWERDVAKAVVNPGSAPAELASEPAKKPIRIEGVSRKSQFFNRL